MMMMMMMVVVYEVGMIGGGVGGVRVVERVRVAVVVTAVVMTPKGMVEQPSHDVNHWPLCDDNNTQGLLLPPLPLLPPIPLLH